MSKTNLKVDGFIRNAKQWKEEAIIIDHKLRSEMFGEWKKWFTENIIGG